MKKWLLVVLILLVAMPALAEDYYKTSGPLMKLKRGAINVGTSPLEIVRELKEHWKEAKNHPADKMAYTFGGFVKGMVFFVKRLGSGLWDIATCNIEIPADNEPLLKPDYVFGEK